MFRKKPKKIVNDLEKAISNFALSTYTTPEKIDECLGYKLAYLKSFDPLLCFESLFSGEYFYTGLFSCPKSHDLPTLECSCGFHSYKDFKKALKERRFFRKTMVLQVENYGTVIEHDTGWRAQEQVVTGVALPKRCSFFICRQRTYGMLKGHHNIESRCKRHFEKRVSETKEGYSVEGLKTRYPEIEFSLF